MSEHVSFLLLIRTSFLRPNLFGPWQFAGLIALRHALFVELSVVQQLGPADTQLPHQGKRRHVEQVTPDTEETKRERKRSRLKAAVSKWEGHTYR